MSSKSASVMAINSIIELNNQAAATLQTIVNNNNAALRTLIADIASDDQLPEYMDYTQASKYLSIPKGTLYQRKCKNQIPYVQSGSKVLFKRSDLDEWLLNHRVPSNEELLRA